MSKAMQTMTVEVVWYTDLMQDEDGGWSINNQSRNDHKVEMPDFTESAIVKMLKQQNYIKESARSNSFTWEWLDDCGCILTYKGKPLCEVTWVKSEEDIEDNEQLPTLPENISIKDAMDNAEIQNDGDFTELYEDTIKQVGDVKIGDYDSKIVVFTRTKPNNKNRCLSPRQFRKLAFDITRNHKKTRVALKTIKKMEKYK